MDKKVYKGTTFSRNPKNFKENVWRAKKFGYYFSVFRKNFKWRIEAQNTKASESLNLSNFGFEELEDAFEYIINYKKNEQKN